MSFEIVARGVFGCLPPILEGECSIDRGGKLTLLASDLLESSIDREAVLMSDPELMRIALRPVREGEQRLAVKISPLLRGRTDSGRRTVNVARAIKRCGLDPKACAGRYELLGKSDLLIVAFTSEHAIPAEVARLEHPKTRADEERRAAARRGDGAQAKGDD